MLVEGKQAKVLEEGVGDTGSVLVASLPGSHDLVVAGCNVGMNHARGSVSASVQLLHKG